jgi:PAS domain S-box-containing protein
MKLDQANILMVDDQPAKLLSYEVILSELGENLIQARSAREALDQLLRHDIAVVLMDVSMPEMDGFELADMMHQHPRFQKTAIIFISAVHLTDVDRIKGYQSGAVDYISVPVVPELLRAKVGVFAELHRKTRQLERLNRELEHRVEERTEQLRESEQQFRTLANSIPQLAWMADATGSVFWYNQRWYEFMGIPDNDLPKWGWRSAQHPDHLDRVMARLELSWKTGDSWEDTFPLRGADGSYVWFLSRAVPIRDSSGNIVRWFGTCTDISAQVIAEDRIRSLNRQLEERLAELEAIMQVLPVGVAVAQDAQSHVVTGNSALASILGTSLGENIADVMTATGNILEFWKNGAPLPPEDHPLFRAALTGEISGSLELEVRRYEANPIHVLASASPLFDHDGKVRGAVGAFFDITDRKQLEYLLRERADLLELATEAIMVHDRQGVVRFWNAGAEALYGWKSHEAIGRVAHELLRTEFPESFAEVDAALGEAGNWDGDLTQMTREGRAVVVASRQALKPDSDVVLEINRDITAELKAKEALRKTEGLAAMGRMAGIIAHEINNPLESITNTFYLLRDHPSLDEEARYYARLGEEELHRVAHITRQTLGFYRESRNPVEVSLSALLDDIVDLQLRRLELSNIIVERRYSTERTIHGFPVELKQVFLNLIGNAVQAMPDGGRLRLHVFEPALRSEVCISICDTGTGIDAESAKHLFEPFFTTKSTKGTGLGLWISKGIIQKYGGSIRFRTTLMNGCRTTCFQVRVPVAEFAMAHSSALGNSSPEYKQQLVGESNGRR